jgi:hypothetical protein
MSDDTTTTKDEPPSAQNTEFHGKAVWEFEDGGDVSGLRIWFNNGFRIVISFGDNKPMRFWWMNEDCDFFPKTVEDYADFFGFAAMTKRQYSKTSGDDLSANPDYDND